MSGLAVKAGYDPDGLVHLAPMRPEYLERARCKFQPPGLRCVSACGKGMSNVSVVPEDVDCMACIAHANDDFPPEPALTHFKMRTTEINAGEVRDAIRRERGLHR